MRKKIVGTTKCRPLIANLHTLLKGLRFEKDTLFKTQNPENNHSSVANIVNDQLSAAADELIISHYDIDQDSRQIIIGGLLTFTAIPGRRDRS